MYATEKKKGVQVESFYFFYNTGCRAAKGSSELERRVSSGRLQGPGDLCSTVGAEAPPGDRGRSR